MQTAAAVERPNYLNIAHTAQSWLLTRDHKRIGILYLLGISFFFAVGGLFALGIRLELLTPGGDVFESETYNKVFTMHGVAMVFFFLIPSIPATLGNFLVPMMIGAKDLAFPRINLLSWYIYMAGGLFTLSAVLLRRRRHRLDVLHAVQHGGQQHARRPDGPRHLHQRVLVDPDGPQLHRDDPHDARAGNDVGPHAAVHLGALRHRADHDPGHAGGRDRGAAGGARAHAAHRHLRSEPGRRPGALPAPVLVLLAPRGLHHGAARHGRDQRADRGVLAQGDLRLQVRGLLEPRHRADRASSCGATTCTSAASRCTRAWSSRS